MPYESLLGGSPNAVFIIGRRPGARTHPAPEVFAIYGKLLALSSTAQQSTVTDSLQAFLCFLLFRQVFDKLVEGSIQRFAETFTEFKAYIV